MTNLTPAQLEQFEGTFRYFDKDETNTLSQAEMSAALASLGIVYSVRDTVLSKAPVLTGLPQDDDMDVIYDQLLQDYGAVTYEAFINLLVGRRSPLRDPACSCIVRRWTSQKTRRRRISCARRSVGSRATRCASPLTFVAS
jgi:hypothetical protein